MSTKRQQQTIPFSDQIRAAVEASDVTRYRIAQETGISQSTLSRFQNGERGLPMETLDILAAFLDLHITNTPAEYSKPARNQKRK